MPTFAHIDADCFFASVELRKRPDLRGKPVLVCNQTNRRGIVVSATYEARPFGIRAGTPIFQAAKLCPQAILIPCNFIDYQRTSLHLMSIFQNFSPEVEISSIDEAYLDLTGLRQLYRTDYLGIGSLIQKTVLQKLGITISVGIAGTKLLAKLASDFKKPAGLTLVTSKGREDFLKKIPVRDISGVGINTEALLKKFGFITAYDLVSSKPYVIEKILGKRGKDLISELNGVSIFKIVTTNVLPKSLSKTRTFPEFSLDRDYIHSFSLELLLSLSRRLRIFGLETSLFAYFLMNKKFEITGEKKKLIQPTDEDKSFITMFEEMFGKFYQRGEIYRKVGFYFADLRTKGPVQLSIFTKKLRPPVDPVFDKIYEKFGEKGISRGSLLKHI